MPESFFTKIAGVSRDNRQSVIRYRLTEEDNLQLVREPNNPVDGNAVMVQTEAGEMLGYLNSERASEVAPKMDLGWHAMAFVEQITGQNEDTMGVNIEVYLTPPNEIKRPIKNRPINQYFYLGSKIKMEYGKIALIAFVILVADFVLFGALDNPSEGFQNVIIFILLVSIGVFIWSFRKWRKSRLLKK
jgi:hypothetical protein